MNKGLEALDHLFNVIIDFGIDDEKYGRIRNEYIKIEKDLERLEKLEKHKLKKDLKRFNELYDKVKCKLDNAQKDLEIEKNKIDKEVIIYNSSMIKLEQLKGQIIAYNDILTIMEKEMLDE